MNQAVIGIGSNIDPQANVSRAVDLIARSQRLIAVSRRTWTAPIGPDGQPQTGESSVAPSFLNAAARIETQLDLAQLRQWLKGIEGQLGRVMGPDKFAPRTIDLDVVVWNGGIIDDDVYERDFLRRSIVDVWPELVFHKH